MAPTPERRLTQEEFNVLMKACPRTTRMVHERLHKIFVDGRTQTEVADEEGVSLSTVTAAVTRYWRRWLDMCEVPAGMERVEAVLTTQQANTVRSWVRKNVSRRTQDANHSNS